jgi:hypothetical protein
VNTQPWIDELRARAVQLALRPDLDPEFERNQAAIRALAALDDDALDRPAPVVAPPPRVDCSLCGLRFRTRKGLSTHFTRIHC